VSHLLHLEQVLAEESPKVRMDRAALDLATIQFPNLEPEPFLDLLNDLASSLGDRLRNFNDGRDFVEKASSWVFTATRPIFSILSTVASTRCWNAGPESRSPWP
jgi:hypothetical protein